MWRESFLWNLIYVAFRSVLAKLLHTAYNFCAPNLRPNETKYRIIYASSFQLFWLLPNNFLRSVFAFQWNWSENETKQPQRAEQTDINKTGALWHCHETTIPIMKIRHYLSAILIMDELINTTIDWLIQEPKWYVYECPKSKKENNKSGWRVIVSQMINPGG